jgi:hypothetical protein
VHSFYFAKCSVPEHLTGVLGPRLDSGAPTGQVQQLTLKKTSKSNGEKTGKDLTNIAMLGRWKIRISAIFGALT